MPNWHGTKEMWVAWMLDPCCDFQLWPRPWPWLWIFNVKFWNSCIPWVWGLIDMERKGFESIGCYTCYVCSSFDLDLGFWSGCGLETFLSWWPLQPCGQVLKFFMATTWIIPSFFNLVVMCRMLSTFHVSSQFVANISESSLLFSQ